MVRTLVVWCPDWPLTAAGIPPEQPAVVLAANRVLACSAAARTEGVRVGLRQREAQARCPTLVLAEADPTRDARLFEPVVAAVEDLVPAVEVIRPGLLALAVRGPARLYDGEEPAATRLAVAVGAAVEGASGVRQDCRVGVADSAFAATLAARQAAPILAIVPGGTPAFLASLPASALAQLAPARDPAGSEVADLVELLRRLGIRTLGDLAALPAVTVLDRFGRLGALAHRLARGEDAHRLTPRTPPPDLVVQAALDPPAQRVDVAAFAARGLADELDDLLGRHGVTATLVTIEAQTDHGEALARRWRCHDGFTPPALTDRLRWQLDGWLAGTVPEERPTAGISLLRLVPVEVVPTDGHQPALWGGPTAADLRAIRALTRLQGMLGPDAVLSPRATTGGRDPATWIVPVRWGEDAAARRGGGPWPGRVPPPAPATVLPEPLPAEVADTAGHVVGVSGRGVVTAAPDRIRIGRGPWRAVVGWAGPWPADERWWDADRGCRRARFQVTTDDGAYLLALSAGRWQVEAEYD